MSQVLKNLKVGLDDEIEDVIKKNISFPLGSFRILKKTIDARRGHPVHFIYHIEVFSTEEEPSSPQLNTQPLSKKYTSAPVIIVGSGPAGLFAAIRLLEKKIPCLILEQGSPAEKRILSINRFWRYGELDPKNNVCFGEGGAGLYSDGKLITRIKSPHIPYVLNRLVQFGAPKEIEYLSNPHIGSDKIRRLIPKLRQYILSLGGKFHFDTCVKGLIFNNKNIEGVETECGKTFHSPSVILATGHSNSDIFYHLDENGVSMEGKSYAIGLRIEHPQSFINKAQYREYAEHPKLESANYKLTYHNKKEDFGVYSFCMCPGGYVLSSGTEADGLVCNGMSNFRRNSPFANSALVVTLDHQKNFGTHLFAGLEFRREIEKKAFQAVRDQQGHKQLPAQTLNDFFNNKQSGDLRKGSSPSQALGVNFKDILPPFLHAQLTEGLLNFENKIRHFTSSEALLYGVETRTSCPIRILRDKENLQSLSHKGLYPTGEGAGYAGGITSAACDGVRVADAIANHLP